MLSVFSNAFSSILPEKKSKSEKRSSFSGIKQVSASTLNDSSTVTCSKKLSDLSVNCSSEFSSPLSVTSSTPTLHHHNPVESSERNMDEPYLLFIQDDKFHNPDHKIDINGTQGRRKMWVKKFPAFTLSRLDSIFKPQENDQSNGLEIKPSTTSLKKNKIKQSFKQVIKYKSFSHSSREKNIDQVDNFSNRAVPVGPNHTPLPKTPEDTVDDQVSIHHTLFPKHKESFIHSSDSPISDNSLFECNQSVSSKSHTISSSHESMQGSFNSKHKILKILGLSSKDLEDPSPYFTSDSMMRGPSVDALSSQGYIYCGELKQIHASKLRKILKTRFCILASDHHLYIYNENDPFAFPVDKIPITHDSFQAKEVEKNKWCLKISSLIPKDNEPILKEHHWVFYCEDENDARSWIRMFRKAISQSSGHFGSLSRKHKSTLAKKLGEEYADPRLQTSRSLINRPYHSTMTLMNRSYTDPNIFSLRNP